MKVVIHPAYQQLLHFIEELPNRFDSEGVLLYKGRNVVKQYLVEGYTLVVKRYKRPHLIQRIVYTFFKPSKMERAYRFAAMLREKEIDTPQEVAYIETFEGGLFSVGYFVSFYCSYPPVWVELDVEEFQHKFSNPQSGNVAETFAMKETSTFNYLLADRLAEFFVELHTKGVLHGDLNLSNILYHQQADSGYVFSLIDTNRSVFKIPNRRECLRNLVRVTHRRKVLVYLIAKYAELRGWNPEECMNEIIERLNKFERKEHFKHAFRRCITNKH